MDFDIFDNTQALPVKPPTIIEESLIIETDKFTLNSTSHTTLCLRNTSVSKLEIHDKYSKKHYNFELDTFQKLSLSAIERNENLLISAHTSAGKTVIAEYAIAHCVLNQQRCIYTSPIKALSNQKYRELQALCDGNKMYNENYHNQQMIVNDMDFGSNTQIEPPSVGLLTGDVTINPNASILVMTTEILRNMLYRGSTILKEVNYIIFDEIHYLKDPERGVVWEEAIILAPSHFRFVFLSATIPNAVEFGSWIVDITKMPCHLVSTNRRPTPLEHYLWVRDRPHLILYDEKEQITDSQMIREDECLPFNSSDAAELSSIENNDQKGSSTYNSTKETRNNTQISCENSISRKPDPRPSCTIFDHKEYLYASKNVLIKRRLDDSDINSIVSYIKSENLLPTIIFAFSRKECEKYALGIKNDFLDEQEKEKIFQIFQSAISGLKEEEQNLDLIQKFLPHLQQGIGIHHAGLLPIIKEIVEILFQENLLKVLFATETFSIGLNMPAKCVVFTSLKKFDGEEKRFLKSGEYIQMSGRAGRRNLDKKGLVFSMLNEQISFKDGKRLFSGLADRLDSAFRLSYNMILNLMRIVDYDPVFLIKRSFFYFQSQNKLRNVFNEIKSVKIVVDEIVKNDPSLLSSVVNDFEGFSADFLPDSGDEHYRNQSLSTDQSGSENQISVSISRSNLFGSLQGSKNQHELMHKQLHTKSNKRNKIQNQATNDALKDVESLGGMLDKNYLSPLEPNDKSTGSSFENEFISSHGSNIVPSKTRLNNEPIFSIESDNCLVFTKIFLQSDMSTNLSILDPNIAKKMIAFKPKCPYQLCNILEGYIKIKKKRNYLRFNYYLRENLLQKGRLVDIVVNNQFNIFSIKNCKIVNFNEKHIVVEFFMNKIIQNLRIKKENLDKVFDIMAMNVKALREAIKTDFQEVRIQKFIKNYAENDQTTDKSEKNIKIQKNNKNPKGSLNSQIRNKKGVELPKKDPEVSKTNLTNQKTLSGVANSEMNQDVFQNTLQPSTNHASSLCDIQFEKIQLNEDVDFDEISYLNAIIDHIENDYGQLLFLNTCLLCKKDEFELDCLSGKCLDDHEIKEKAELYKSHRTNILKDSDLVNISLSNPSVSQDNHNGDYRSKRDHNHRYRNLNAGQSGKYSSNYNKSDRDCNSKQEFQSNHGYNSEIGSKSNLGQNSGIGSKSNLGQNSGIGSKSNHGYNSGIGSKSNLGYNSGIGSKSNHGYNSGGSRSDREYNRYNSNNISQYSNNTHHRSRNNDCNYHDSRGLNQTEPSLNHYVLNGLHSHLIKTKYITFYNNLNEELNALKQIYHLNECKKMIQVLRRLSYYDKQISIKGRVACEISTANELLLVELIFTNAFESMKIDEIVALLSCLVFHETDNQSSLSLVNKKNYNHLVDIMKKLVKIMNDCGIEISTDDYIKRYSWEMMDIAQAWVNGKSFVEICSMSDIFEGSIIRCFRRLEELLKQLCAAAREIGNSELENMFAEGIVKIKRDIVFSSSLYV